MKLRNLFKAQVERQKHFLSTLNSFPKRQTFSHNEKILPPPQNRRKKFLQTYSSRKKTFP